MKIDNSLIALVLPLASLIVITVHMLVCFKYSLQNEQVKIEPCKSDVQMNNRLNELEAKVDKLFQAGQNSFHHFAPYVPSQSLSPYLQPQPHVELDGKTNGKINGKTRGKNNLFI
ncbi:hypothetical protein RclHR1_20960002 [Rhizophagus clarus]|uniref:Transmembrane protein n=1 Tax=Rhizophagus clarus TaxID=94130 RepID=A0A2Z6QU37_9GLOM|nr:hypothetical protein RclHR1_20960002 [Rhizophagus clarus]GES99432.1 hypothetical protein RCL_jg14934.t1 [Rhizophagus clarus]